MLRKTTFALLLLLVLVPASHAADLELSDCRVRAGPGYPGIKARCGTLFRALNPADPASEQIALRVAVVPALNLSPATDPVVPLAGGPGDNLLDPGQRSGFGLTANTSSTGQAAAVGSLSTHAPAPGADAPAAKRL